MHSSSFNFQGLSETALFALSEGKKIPKLGAVLVGMLPITMDVLLRVLGQAVVLVVAPPLGLLSALLKEEKKKYREGLRKRTLLPLPDSLRIEMKSE